MDTSKVMKQYKSKYTKKSGLKHIGRIVAGANFFMDRQGGIFWDSDGREVDSITTLPHRLQIPFLIKFIQDHELSERIKDIEDPIVCIELYLKARFVTNGFLNLRA